MKPVTLEELNKIIEELEPVLANSPMFGESTIVLDSIAPNELRDAIKDTDRFKRFLEKHEQ